MANNNKIVALVIAITIGAVFLAPVADIVTSNSGTQTVDNATVTTSLDYNQTYELDGYDIVTDSDTIERYNTTSGSWETLTKGTDYEIDYAAAELDVTDTSATDAGDELRASYNWEATDGTTGTIVELIPLLMALLLLVPLANRVRDGV